MPTTGKAMEEDLINKFISELPTSKLDAVVNQLIEEAESSILESIFSKTVNHMRRLKEGVGNVGKLLAETRDIPSVEIARYLDTIRNYLHQADFSLSTLKELQRQWSEVGTACEQLISVKRHVARYVYEYTVCCNFINSDKMVQLTSAVVNEKEIEELSSAELLNKLLEAIKTRRKESLVSRKVDGCAPSEHNTKNMFVQEAISICKIPESEKHKFENRLLVFLEILTNLKIEILLHVVNGRGKYSANARHAIELSKRSASTECMDLEIIEQYGNFVIDSIFANPTSEAQPLLNSIVDNCRSEIEFWQCESKTSRILEVKPSWLLSNQLTDIELRKQTFTYLQSDEGQVLISKYYSASFNPNYDLNESIQWASCAAFRSYGPAKKELAMLQLIAGNKSLAASLYRSLSNSCDDADVDYALSSFLYWSPSKFENELAERLAKRGADKGHPGAVCLLGKLAHLKWQNGASFREIELALTLYQQAATLGFGRAIVEVELHSLEGWHRSAKKLEQEDATVYERLIDITADELDAYNFLRNYSVPENLKSNWKDKLVAIAEETKLITNKFLVGNILGTNELAIEILEDAGRSGHPEACSKLSEIYETRKRDYQKSLAWYENYLKNELMFAGIGGGRDVYPRIDHLKQKICRAWTQPIEHAI